MNELRALAESSEPAWDNDTSAVVLAIPDRARFLVLAWYKTRGRTGTAIVVDDEGHSYPLTLSDAEAILATGNGKAEDGT